jgi:hypothetical protein
VIERLELHGVKLNRLSRAQTLTVDSYRFQNPEWKQRPFEGRHELTVTLEKIKEERTYPPGSVVIDMNQPAARVVAHVLEPEAPDSYIHWGFFDAIFEQKEYAESYVMEKMAREMLANDEALRRDFETKKNDDPEFAKNPRAILNWFYQHTPYWDDRINIYPVGKIFERDQVNALR